MMKWFHPQLRRPEPALHENLDEITIYPASEVLLSKSRIKKGVAKMKQEADRQTACLKKMGK